VAYFVWSLRTKYGWYNGGKALKNLKQPAWRLGFKPWWIRNKNAERPAALPVLLNPRFNSHNLLYVQSSLTLTYPVFCLHSVFI
jgi:hypothetical protein